jgi:hypothetical protein
LIGRRGSCIGGITVAATVATTVAATVTTTTVAATTVAVTAKAGKSGVGCSRSWVDLAGLFKAWLNPDSYFIKLEFWELSNTMAVKVIVTIRMYQSIVCMFSNSALVELVRIYLSF